MQRHPIPKQLILLAALVFLLAACTSASEAPRPTPDEEQPPTDSQPQPTGTAVAAPVAAEMAIPPTEESAPAEMEEVTTLIDDEEAVALMDQISSGTAQQVNQALARIEGAQDQRFISVLIDAYRAGQLGLLITADAQPFVDTLENLSGQSFGSDWPAWVEWYGNTDLQPPPGFTGWKGRMLARIDPRFADFLQESHPANLRVEEIQWGGVLVDGIPALDNPKMLSADKASYLDAQDAVFGIALNGEARAYPLRILDWHEMANDVVGGVPVSLAYCTLCGAAIAFNGDAADGNSYTFGSSGFLYRSNKLMYDRQTGTLWNQLTGEPVLGELVGQDLALDLLPIVLTSWEDWQNQHPDTLVVDENTGFPRNYAAGAAYGNYFASSETMFPVAQRSDLLPAKEQIYALRVAGTPKAYPLQTLAAESVLNDSIGGTNLLLVAPRGVVQVDGDNQYVGPVTYQAGGEVRAFERGERQFSPGADEDSLLDEAGNEWLVTEEALLGPDGATLPRIPGHLAYWFGWYAFFPETLIYGYES